MFTVKVHFKDPGQSSISIKNISRGQSLLEVLLNNNIMVRHDCGGICTCSTCHIFVQKGNNFLEEQSRREKDILSKKIIGSQVSRLSCQCIIIGSRGHVEISLTE